MVSAMEIPEKINELLMSATDEKEAFMILELVIQEAMIMQERLTKSPPALVSIH